MDIHEYVNSIQNVTDMFSNGMKTQRAEPERCVEVTTVLPVDREYQMRNTGGKQGSTLVSA